VSHFPVRPNADTDASTPALKKAQPITLQPGPIDPRLVDPIALEQASVQTMLAVSHYINTNAQAYDVPQRILRDVIIGWLLVHN
jgi:hypothetical protein